MRGVTVLIAAFLCLSAHAQNYHWPMDAPPALTSTFGEYRGGRLHAAVDLKTWGKEGYPVTVVADGYVWRVRTSPWGYGRVVYVRLNNGLFVLWAHLSGFSEHIEKYVQQEQNRHGKYSVNLYFRPDQLPVKRGEVVGYSGSTGIGVPHLHFEVRDDKHQPINPLTHGFDVEDTVPPTLTAIGLAPLDVDASVKGGYEPVSLALADRGTYFAHVDTVDIWGRVGVGVKVFDRADASELTNRLAPYRMWLLVDGKEVFRKSLDKFAYEVTHHGELAFDFFMSRRGLGRFHSLYRRNGNRLPFYGRVEAGQGVLQAGKETDDEGLYLLPGVHRLEVIAEDVKGNRANAVVVVRVVQKPVIEALKTVWAERSAHISAQVKHARRVKFEQSDDGGKTWAPVGQWRGVRGYQVRHTLPRAELFRMCVENAGGQEAFETFAVLTEDVAVRPEVVYYPSFAVIRIETDRILSAKPNVQAKFPKGRARGLPVRQTGLTKYETIVAFDEKQSGQIEVQIKGQGYEKKVLVTQHTVTAQKGGEVRSENGLVRARFEKDKVYQTLFGHVYEDSVEADERMVGPAVQIVPHDVAFEEAELAFVCPRDYPNIDKLGIYEWNDRKGWVFVDMGRDSTLGAVTGKVKRFGRYAMLVDNVPPEIEKVIPAEGALVGERQPKITVHVKDASSGIWREEDMIVKLNGKALIVEYDPEEDLMFAKPRRPLEAGSHQLDVVVRDICGNEAKTTRAFRIK